MRRTELPLRGPEALCPLLMPYRPRLQRALGGGQVVAALALLLACNLQAQTSPAPVSAAPAPSQATDVARAPAWLNVSPGQSALELAIEQVPAGVTVEQFLLALYRQNPQAFAAGDYRQLTGSRLRLPTAEQASSVSAEQARGQLRALRSQAPAAADRSVALDAAGRAAAGSAQLAAAPADPSGPPSEPSSASPMASPAASAEGVGPPPEPAAAAIEPARPVHPMVLVIAGLALLVILILFFRRSDGPSPRASPRSGAASAARSPARGRAGSTPGSAQAEGALAEPAQQGYRPALPLSGAAPEAPSSGSQSAGGQTADLPPPPGPLPGKLGDLTDLPSLDLDSPAVATGMAARELRPAAPAQPLDLSGINLDLGSPDQGKT